MNKSYSRDVQQLSYILENQMNIREVIRKFGCDFSTNSSRSILNDKIAFDCCSMYMMQIGENAKLLTDTTKNEFNKIVDTQVLTYFRNKITHAYESTNKLYLMPYIQLMQSDNAINHIKSLIRECNAKKRR